MRRATLTIALILGLMFGATSLAQTLRITARMVEGGVNDLQYRWLNDYIKPEFERLNPGVTVELIQFGGSDEALKEQYALDLSVGAGADVMGFDGFWIPEFADGRMLRPLREVGGPAVDDWEGWSHIPAGLQALTSYNGENYGIALGTDYRMIYTRIDLLEAAGISDAANWQPSSWDDILAAARALKQANPDSYPLQINAGTAMGEATTMQGYYMVLLGTGHFLLDDAGRWIVRSQGILDTLELYQTIYVDEQLGDARLQLLQDGRNRTFANFRDGLTALLVEGDFFYRGPTSPGQEFAVENRDQVMGWAMMPAQQAGAGFRGQDYVTISGGTGFVLNPNSANGELAWQLLAFMNSREALMAGQEIQPRIRARDDVPVPGVQFLIETAAALNSYTTARPNMAVYPEVSFQAQLMTERVVSGEMTPLQAMNAFAQAVTDIAGAANVVDQLGQ